jgi:hypothetical protein
MGVQEDWVSEREEFIEVRLVRGFGGESGRERSCQKDVRQNCRTRRYCEANS